MIKRDRNIKKALLTLLISGFVFISFCALVYASSEAEGGEGLKGDLMDLAKRVLCFTLMVAVLFWVIKKANLKSFFAARIEEIRHGLEDLRKGKEEAERKYREAEEKVKQFELQHLEIIGQFKAEGAAEKEKIVAEAQQKARDILAQAQSAIQQELQSARNLLKQEIVNLAAQKAEEAIRKELTDKDHNFLVDEFIERVGKIH